MNDHDTNASKPLGMGGIEDNFTSQQKPKSSKGMIRNTINNDTEVSHGDDENINQDKKQDEIGLRDAESLDIWVDDDIRASDSEEIKYSVTRNDDDFEIERKHFPPDCYSFLSLHGPVDNIQFFSFGMMVFIFQFLFLILIVMSVLDQKWRNDGDVDNPGNDIFASFIAANVSPLVRATQVLAVLSYIIFADSSLMDVATAVETYPWHAKEATKCMIFSCILRFTQGAMASAAALLTIITSETVIDIVLNFTALNFISQLDDVAFELAIDGRYGRKLEAEAKRITELEMPYCMSNGNKQRRFLRTLVFLAICLLSILTAIIYCQESKNVWLTKVLRVEFQDETLMVYSGCYEMNKTASISSNVYKRNIYTRTYNQLDQAHFGYCIHKNRWMLFKDATDACSADDGTLAYSAKTSAFDVSTAFGEGWYSASGTPLDLYFIELDRQLESKCSSFDDGICNDFFNTFTFQYDGGDCCSATCSRPNCGIDGLEEVFGTENATGVGFPNCLDPIMVPLTIRLDNFTSSRTPSNMLQRFGEEEIEKLLMMEDEEFWLVDPTYPSLELRCDGKNVFVVGGIDVIMSNQTETVFVNDRATCTIKVANKTGFRETVWDPPIWYFDVAIFLGNNADSINPNILGMNTGEQGSASFDVFSIPPCLSKRLSDHINMRTIYIDNILSLKAIRWIIEGNAGTSYCDDSLTDVFALSVLNYGAPVAGSEEDSMWIESTPPCMWAVTECNNGTTLSSLKVSAFALSGTISTTLGLLTSLSTLSLDGNSLTGQIPSEIGFMSRLETLRLAQNRLSGEIPSEIGLLSSLKELELDNNPLTGTIPPEIGNLTASKVFELYDTFVTGKIPTQIGMLKSLQRIRLEKNDLTGGLLSEIGSLTLLQRLHLEENSLTGKVPSELALLTSLSMLRLEKNNLTGTIPTEIGMLTSSLKVLSLGNNGLIGDIPSEMGLLSLLEMIQFDNNPLTGTIPPEIGNLTASRVFALSNTFVNGKIPTQIAMLKSLLELRLENNDLTGKLLSEIGSLSSLQKLRLGNNSLTGEIPSELGFLPSLHHLDLAMNTLSGTIPIEIGMLNSSLELLALGNNVLTGEIPSEIGLFSSLETLDLNSNRLNGMIPSEIWELRSLNSLVLGNNVLSGTVPTVIGEMTSLILIQLSNNTLSGTIPSEIGLLTTLQYLSLYNNTLSGLLPSEIGKLTLLTHLSVAQNGGLSGLIPSEIGLLSNLTCLELDKTDFETPIPTIVDSILERKSNCNDGMDSIGDPKLNEGGDIPKPGGGDKRNGGDDPNSEMMV